MGVPTSETQDRVTIANHAFVTQSVYRLNFWRSRTHSWCSSWKRRKLRYQVCARRTKNSRCTCSRIRRCARPCPISAPHRMASPRKHSLSLPLWLWALKIQTSSVIIGKKFKSVYSSTDVLVVNLYRKLSFNCTTTSASRISPSVPSAMSLSI